MGGTITPMSCRGERYSQSDHNPIVLNTRSLIHDNKPLLFKFERGWFFEGWLLRDCVRYLANYGKGKHSNGEMAKEN